MEPIDLAILGATPGEIAPISLYLEPVRSFRIAGNPFGIHKRRDISLLIGTTGIGKVNAAAITSAVLAGFTVRAVWNVGCAGAYAGSGLRIGDVLITSECLCGDEGILNRHGRCSAGPIQIPLLFKDDVPLYDRFPPSRLHERVRTVLTPGSYAVDSTEQLQLAGVAGAGENLFAVQYGPSLTVGMVSGDMETAGERFEHHRAKAENMEGSAVAQTCRLFGVDFIECRGISNIAGVRDKEYWDFTAAIDHSAAVVRYLLDRLF